MKRQIVEPYVHNPAYDQNFIIAYGNWLLFLNSNQRFLGRSYAWWGGGHIDRMDISQVSPADLDDLMKGVASAYLHATKMLWGATHLNYSWLGNEVRKHKGHGHLHLVPRYFDGAPMVAGKAFPDPAPEKNWSAIESGPQVLTSREMAEVRDALRNALMFENATKVRTLEQFLDR